jgi:hypothetical protein
MVLITQLSLINKLERQVYTLRISIDLFIKEQAYATCSPEKGKERGRVLG